ncbi:hypothetical protein GH714_017472 [Hevea brasiliensis]|uniref:MULE transposase domain-containing protein n=1 Tax=Hevea brasiliensis TaxID=3981 RepID=A0A6A6M7C7_HEVBR|nr:hypothetical protein GH714_017472 [Hevea brasiliensis]
MGNSESNSRGRRNAAEHKVHMSDDKDLMSDYEQSDDDSFLTPYSNNENEIGNSPKKREEKIVRNGNNQMFLIAWCAVEGENEHSWRWFLERLFEDINEIFGLMLTLSDQHKMDLAEAASRPLHIHPPPTPRASLTKPKPPSANLYAINRYKFTEKEAFRPTQQGHSPGVGHGNPPTAP